LSDSQLNVKIRHKVGTLALDMHFALTQPWTVLFGPSGGGKTSVMRAIGGFVHPDEGVITYGTDVLLDRAAGIFVPAHARPVRSAGQLPRLFPHMTVRRNVLYGSGWRSKPTDERRLSDEVLTLFRLNSLAERMPRDLSGGEKQRVSVARAVVSAATSEDVKKSLLLLDEPFTGLDSRIRDSLAAEVPEWLAARRIQVLSVTHDIGEAFLLGAEVIKIADGRVIHQGPVCEVLAEERQKLLEQLDQR
jgi:molybdate transport system ATP-binding protein